VEKVDPEREVTIMDPTADKHPSTLTWRELEETKWWAISGWHPT